MARINIDPSAAADKWAGNLSRATEDMKRGAEAVTEAPGKKAAAQADLWLRKINESKAKFARRVASVSLEDWKQAYVDKGLARVGQGAQAAKPKMTQFLGELLPFQERALSELERMPRGDFAQNIQRMVAWSEKMHQFKRGTSGGGGG